MEGRAIPFNLQIPNKKIASNVRMEPEMQFTPRSHSQFTNFHVCYECIIGTYDHRSVRTGHPVRNHRFSIRICLFDEDPGKEDVVFPET
jgi:hypothetical protein